MRDAGAGKQEVGHQSHMGCPQTSVSLLVQVLHLPSSCLGGTSCQWDQSGVFAGLYLVWTSLTSLSSCSQPSGRWGTLVATLLVALPQSQQHVVTVTLACVNMALSSESRAHEEGTEQ